MKKYSLFAITLALAGCISYDTRLQQEREKAELETLAKIEKVAAEAEAEKNLINLFKVLDVLDKDICTVYNSYDGCSRSLVTAQGQTPIDIALTEKFLEPVSTKERAIYQKCATEEYEGAQWSEGIYDECDDFAKTHDLKRCLFNWREYLPAGAKISSYDNLQELYSAYNESIEECDKTKTVGTGEFVCEKNTSGGEKCYEKERNVTAAELQACYSVAAEKATKIATSGNL